MVRSSAGTLVRALRGATARRGHRVALPSLLCAVAAMGCGTDYVSPATPTDPSQLFATLALDHHAIVLSTTAPWNTIQLTATPMNVDGEPLTGLPAATYSLSDSGSVAITPDGELTALAPASGVLVIASMSGGNSTRKDTAYVTVTDVPTAPVLTTFSIQPAPGDTTVPA